jgi:hypothetical protein
LHISKHSYRLVIAGIALLAVLLRASIPVGFMPGPGGHLMLCHDGMHMPQAPHSHYEHCQFGGGSAPAPAPSISLITAVTVIEQARPVRVEAPVTAIKLVYLPHSRGPPFQV